MIIAFGYEGERSCFQIDAEVVTDKMSSCRQLISNDSRKKVQIYDRQTDKYKEKVAKC